MFFGGGLQGFIDDIGCAFESAVHTATHPEIWGINNYTPPKEEKVESLDDLLKILDSLGADEDAIKRIAEIINKMDDISITKEEYEKLLAKLKDIKITISLADVLSDEDTAATKKSKPEQEPVKKAVNTTEEVDEDDKMSFKDAIMSTPLGKKLKLFEEVDDAVPTT